MMNRIPLGNALLTRVLELQFEFPAALFPQTPQEAWQENAEELTPTFYDPGTEQCRVAMQSWVVEVDGLTVVIDTGVGNDRERPHLPGLGNLSNDFLGALQRADIDPADVDIVVNTHLHTDHVGWNTRLVDGSWVPTFPNARYLISRREWDHWQAAGMAALARTGDYITDSVLPVFAAGQADLVGDEHAVASEISVELAPGHTPGQMMVRLGSGREQAILSADLMHHPLQVRYPEWSTRFCTDPMQARTTRINFFNEQANTGRLIFPAHFPSPTGGTIERDGKDFRFIFDGEI